MKGRMASHTEHTHQEMRDSLRSLGLRATSSRLAVLSTLHDHAGPLSHDELMERMETGRYDRASIYRILADLSEAGLLTRMDLGDHIWRYELIDACRAIAEGHAHFLCLECREAICLPEIELRATQGPLPPALRGADIQIQVTGRCANCVSA